MNLQGPIKQILYRTVNDRVRYYSLCAYPTLFGDYILIKEYGGLKNKKPTRIIKDYFADIQSLLKYIESFTAAKIKKGYHYSLLEVL